MANIYDDLYEEDETMMFDGLGQEMILPDGEHFIVSDPGPVPQSEMDQVQGLGQHGGNRGILRGLWAVVAPNGDVVAVVRGRARAVLPGYQLKRIATGSIPQDMMRAKAMLQKHFTKGLNPGPLSPRQQAFLKKKGWWNYQSPGRLMPIRDQERLMPPQGPGPAVVPASGTWGLGQDNGGSIMIHEDQYPSSGAGPAKVPGQGTWGLGYGPPAPGSIAPHPWPRTVQQDVNRMHSGGSAPAYSRQTPGIPEELGATMYFENGQGRGGDYEDVPGGVKRLNGGVF
jgi:hypothetical protein